MLTDGLRMMCLRHGLEWGAMGWRWQPATAAQLREHPWCDDCAALGHAPDVQARDAAMAGAR